MKSIFALMKQYLNIQIGKQKGYLDQNIATASDLGIAIDQMSLSAEGLTLICNFEGLHLKAYDDGRGVWTIGFGTTFYPNQMKVKKGDTCTVAQAKMYMLESLKKFEHTVNETVSIQLHQNQFDALVSLTYNIGSNAFKKSTLVKKLNTQDIQGAAHQFDVWVNAGGKKMQGLVNRRAQEKALFLSSADRFN